MKTIIVFFIVFWLFSLILNISIHKIKSKILLLINNGFRMFTNIPENTIYA